MPANFRVSPSGQPETIRVAVFDPYPVVREGIIAFLGRVDEAHEMALSVVTYSDLWDISPDVDIILLDLRLSDDASLAVIPALQDAGARVLIYTGETRVVPLRRAVEAGASGILLKSDPLEAIPAAIVDAISGEFVCSSTLAGALLNDGPVVPELSGRQIQVLRAIDEGLDRRATARVLGISESVVKTHLARIREKYQQNGIEPGNSHHLTHLASVDGYLR